MMPGRVIRLIREPYTLLLLQRPWRFCVNRCISNSMIKKVQSRTRQKAGTKPLPYQIRLAVVMTGGPDTSKGSLMLSTPTGIGILFNCGDGLLRHVAMNDSLKKEAWVSKGKLKTIFITHKSWECIAGLHGLTLSKHSCAALNDFSKTKEEKEKERSANDIEIYGPHGIEHYIYMTKSISTRISQTGNYKAVHRKGMYKDSAFTISSITFKEKTPNPEARKRCKEADGGQETAFAYIIKAHPLVSKGVSIENCVDLGITSVTMVQMLTKGENVTLDDGRVITPNMVSDKPLHIERPILIIDCPTKYFLESMTSNKDLEQYMTSDPDKCLDIVCHFTPLEIYNTDVYQAWIKRFHSSTHHLIMNHSADEMDMEPVRLHHSKLNLLHPGIFPPFRETHIDNPGLTSALSEAVIDDASEPPDQAPAAIDWGQGRLVKAVQGLCYNYRGKDRGFTVYQREYDFEQIGDLDENAEFVKELASLKKKLPSTFAVENDSKEEEEENDSGSKGKGIIYPQFLFLGTGSMEPQTIRSQSCTLLQLSKDTNMILDCGEDGYGQMVRYFGHQATESIMRKVKAIFVSHMHADHHIGFLTFLKQRELAFTKKGETFTPCYVMGPLQFLRWLKFYHEQLGPISHLFKFIGHQDEKLGTRGQFQEATIKELKHNVGLAEYQPVLVNHGNNCYGVTLTHNGTKITYSGDTRPCQALIEAGKDSDILIHEATHDDSLIDLAKQAKHTTFSEAVAVSRRMNAKLTILTHFSARWPHMPPFDGVDIQGPIGVAFDNMKVNPSTLSHLPLLIPALNAMFEDEMDILRTRTEKKMRKYSQEKSSQPSYKSEIVKHKSQRLNDIRLNNHINKRLDHLLDGS